MPPETRIAAMRRRAGPDTIVATDATLEIDNHRPRRVNEAFFHSPFH